MLIGWYLLTHPIYALIFLRYLELWMLCVITILSLPILRQLVTATIWTTVTSFTQTRVISIYFLDDLNRSSVSNTVVFYLDWVQLYFCSTFLFIFIYDISFKWWFLVWVKLRALDLNTANIDPSYFLWFWWFGWIYLLTWL